MYLLKANQKEDGLQTSDWCPSGFEQVFSNDLVRMSMRSDCCGPKTYQVKDISDNTLVQVVYDRSMCSSIPTYIYSQHNRKLGVIDDTNTSCWKGNAPYRICAPENTPVGYIQMESGCCESKVLHVKDITNRELYYIVLSPDRGGCCSNTCEYSVKSTSTDNEVASIKRKPMRSLELTYKSSISRREKFLILATVIICDISQQSDEDSSS